MLSRRLHALDVDVPREASVGSVTSASEARGILLPVCTVWTIAIVLCGAHLECAVGLAAVCGELGTTIASVIGDLSQCRPVWSTWCFVFTSLLCLELCASKAWLFI
jgi:hypothetical protein